jgi:hypothetical protein
MQNVFRVFFLFCALGATLGACSRDSVAPGETEVEHLLGVANRHQEISEVLADLAMPEGTQVGAVVSHSAQFSDGKLSNPRLILEPSPGYLVTTLVDGDSLEWGLLERTATKELPELLPRASGRMSSEKGELLGELHPFPRRERHFSAAAGFNRWTGEGFTHDTHRCTGCHVDTEITKSGLGLLPVRVGDEAFDALVSPVNFNDTVGEILCVPGDLKLLHRCRCGKERSAESECARFEAVSGEGCRRLEAILRLSPRQHPRYGPTKESPCLVRQQH